MNIIEQYADKINGTFSFFDRIIIKGRELMRCIFDKAGITYAMHDNSFLRLSDPEKAQEL